MFAPSIGVQPLECAAERGPTKVVVTSTKLSIDDLRVEAARLLAESEKTKRTAEKIAEKIERLEKLVVRK